MMVPGAYFRDETIWRGRMIEFACDLKVTLYELGFRAGVIYVAAFLQLEGLSVAVAWASASRCFLAILRKYGEESGQSGKSGATSTKHIAPNGWRTFW
jgi:hypothetical protein